MRTENLIHPGEILREEFIKPLGLTNNKVALALGIPATRVGEITHERRSISADTAIRLGIYFATGPEFWLNLQTNYDLALTRQQKQQEFAQIQALA